jgi:hypothetical protein
MFTTMALNEDDKKEIKDIIDKKIFYYEDKKQCMQFLNTPIRNDIKIEIGNFGCFLLGMFVALIGLGVWGWF